MMQVSDIQDEFEKFKTDITDVSDDIFVGWVNFATRFIYDKVKKIDASRFVQSTSYNVVKPPQSFTLPTNFQDMNQTVCGLYKYNMRKRLVVDFNENGDSGITFSDSGGTSAYNTDIYVEGGCSRGFTGDSAAILLLSFASNINWEDFNDGGVASPNNDYVSIWVYVGNTVPTNVTIEFSTSNSGSDVGVNQLSYTYSSLVAGWNRIKVLKSAFTLTGSADWASLGYLRLSYTGGDSTTNIYWDKLDLVENEVNGNDETDNKIGITGYGSKKQGYYLNGDKIVFTGAEIWTDDYYVQKYIALPPTIDDLTDYITLDGTANTVPIVEDRHMEYMVKAVDVLYEQWDQDPSMESIADFRFVRALDGILESYNRTPQISIIRNNFADF